MTINTMKLPASTMASAYRAGQSAGQNYVDIQRETNKYAMKPAEINKAAYQAQSAEKQVATEVNARAKKAENKAEADIKSAKIGISHDKKLASINSTNRKAGILGAVGMLAGEAIADGRRPEKPVMAKQDFSAGINLIKDQQDALAKRIADRKNAPAEKSYEERIAAEEGMAGSTSLPSAPTNPAALNSSNNGKGGWGALSNVISFGEGTQGNRGYTTQFTGTQFSDMSKHPAQLRTGGGYTSDAAGKYQFLSTTFNPIQKKLGLPDFSAESQEKAGRYLTQQAGVDPDKIITSKDEFRGVMDKIAPTWASMPYSGTSPGGFGKGSSYYGQGGYDVDTLWNKYQQSF